MAKKKASPFTEPQLRSSRIRRNPGTWNPLVDTTDIFCGNRSVDRQGNYDLYDGAIGVKFICFIFTIVALFSTGCAAPMTKVVATRQSETIDQNLFKEGDEVWVTYQDKLDTVIIKKAFVLDTDDRSVKLDARRKRPVDIEYRQIHTLSRPVKDQRFVSLSAGTFSTILLDPPIGGVGLSLRNAPYTNYGIEANLSLGRGRGSWTEFSKWLSATVNWYGYLAIPRTYIFLGLGYIWPTPTESYREEYYDEGERVSSGHMRFGFGVTNPVSKRFNIRVEAQLISVLVGFRVYLERRLHTGP